MYGWSRAHVTLTKICSTLPKRNGPEEVFTKSEMLLGKTNRPGPQWSSTVHPQERELFPFLICFSYLLSFGSVLDAQLAGFFSVENIENTSEPRVYPRRIRICDSNGITTCMSLHEELVGRIRTGSRHWSKRSKFIQMRDLVSVKKGLVSCQLSNC